MRPSKSRCLFNVFVILCASLLIGACAEDDATRSAQERQTTGQKTSAGEHESLTGKEWQNESISMPSALVIDGTVIPVSEIDKRIQLKLFDLDWTRYELRKAALTDYLDEQTRLKPVQSVSVVLEPPTPPRIQLSSELQATAMRFRDHISSAPINLSVFCNYQSSHCARMQTVYQQIQNAYGALVRFEFYDLPLAFHQFAVSASHAVRCAESMGEFEGFHKALWLQQEALNETTYLSLAKQLKLDETQFRTCLQNQTHSLAIENHRLQAEALGFHQVPVTLVNGLYLNGPKPFEIFEYYIDQELQRLGYQSSSATTNQADSTTDSDQEDSMVQDAAEPSTADSAGAETSLERELPSDMPDPDTLEYKARPVVPAVGEIPLSRDWLEDQLLQQSELESHFQPAEHEVEGVRLTKLTGVSQSEFYQTLGLQDGDVLMRVNDQWVHESQNDLFDSLEHGEKVSVVLVRKGLPVHLQYSIRK